MREKWVQIFGGRRLRRRPSLRGTGLVAGVQLPQLAFLAVLGPGLVSALEDNTLTVSGARERVEVEAGRFFRYERPFGAFTRSVALPEGSGDSEARAHFAYGVLEVHVQKPEQSKPRRIPIVPTIESAAIESGSTD